MSADLKLRVLSALVLAPVVLGAVWLGGPSFLLMLSCAVILMAYEWARLTCGPDWHVDAVILAGTALAAILAVFWRPATVDITAGLFLAGAVIAAGSVLSACLGWLRGRELRWRLLGVPYISLGPAALVWLRGLDDVGLMLIIWLLIVIWSMDTGAYFAGRTIGGPKLAPKASPNKTWAGLLGGMVCAGVAGGIMAAAGSFGLPALPLAVISALIGAWSQVGDIAESMVKRHFGVKDMSNLIPGHGGILDRVDGLLFAAPAMLLVFLLSMFAGLASV